MLYIHMDIFRRLIMSRKASLLTTEDVPQYIKNIVSRLSPVFVDYEDEEGNWWGYTYKLTAKWKTGYETQLVNDAEKLVKWAKRWHSHAKIVRYERWEDNVPCTAHHKGDMWHRRKAQRSGYHNSAILVISDPVSNRFERDGFYRE